MLFFGLGVQLSAVVQTLVLNFRYKMDRLEEDLRFFRVELEREINPFRRRLLLERIAITEQRILDLMVEERERLERQNSNMEKALAILRQREQDKKK